MRRKLLALICTLTLCFGCFAVAGCGNSKPEDSDTATVTDIEQEPEEKADPAEKFIGEWKMALAETQGVTMVGDVSSIIDAETGILLKVNNDNTGSLTLSDEGGDFTWELKDDDTLTITIQDEDGEEDKTASLVYKDEALVLDLKNDNFEGKLTFTKDGTIEGYNTVDKSSLKDITSADQLVGSWSLTGYAAKGLTAYGDPETIAAISGTGDMVIAFTDDGTCTLNDVPVKLVVDEEGARLEESGTTIELKFSGDYLAMDITEFANMDAYALFSKTA